VLDLFCGSGALGLESLSRGADEATFVDAGPDAVKAVETNAARLRLTPQTRVLRRDALRPGGWIRPRGRAAYGIVFIDPPYKMTADPAGQADLAAMAARLVELGVVAAGATVMLRAKRGVEIPLPWDGFDLADTRSYGSTTLYLLSPRPGGAGAQGEGDADRRPAGMETA
jgi:16S rRNA (guanine966-N2)-methyltransferase